MIYVIQHTDGRYLTYGGGWTDALLKAAQFRSATAANLHALTYLNASDKTWTVTPVEGQ